MMGIKITGREDECRRLIEKIRLWCPVRFVSAFHAGDGGDVGRIYVEVEDE